MAKKIDEPVALSDEGLDDANGGGLLLQAVQQRLGGEKVISPSSAGGTLTNGESDGALEYTVKPVLVKSYSTGGSGAD